jgi:hypothetical protein
MRSWFARMPGRAKIAIAAALCALAPAIAIPVALAGGGDGGPCEGGDADSFACWQRHLEGVVREAGAVASLNELAALRDRTPYVLSNCHTLAHTVGRAALAAYKTVDEASKHGNGTCWSGYYHGVYEAYMSEFTDEELTGVIPTICKRPPDKPYAFDYYNCLHGIGHGVVIRFGNDVLQGVPYCDVFKEDWERTNCYTGAFMQNIIVDNRMHQSIQLREDDPMYPCNAVDDRYKKACYLGQTSYVLRVLDYDYDEAFDVCDSIEKEYVPTCYVSMGRDISGNSHRDAETVLERCSLGNPAHQENCFVGAVRNAVFHDHGRENADALCLIVPATFRERCESSRDSALESL